MKKALVFSIGLLMLFLSLKDLLTYGHFYANRTVITQTMCVNLDKPQLNCEGMCYLAQQIQDNKDSEEQTPFSSDDNRLPIVYLPVELLSFPVIEIPEKENSPFIYTHNYLFDYSRNLYSPPDLS